MNHSGSPAAIGIPLFLAQAFSVTLYAFGLAESLELIWPDVCADLLAGKLAPRYTGSPTPPARMQPLDYGFFGDRRYLTPASLFATRGCNRRCSFCVSSRLVSRSPFR